MTTSKIRVMVVDDSLAVRRLLTDIVSGEPDMEVVATASNGRTALSRLASAKPDIITLDVEMPEMNGLEALEAIRQQDRKLPIVMCSTLTQKAAATTLDAFALGANDYVTKPTGIAAREEGLGHFRQDLVAKLRFFARGVLPIPLPPGGADGPAPVRVRPAGKAQTGIDLVCIGVSTGGPKALQELLPTLGLDLPVPVVIVQHMPPMFTQLLAQRLGQLRGGQVFEATAGAIAVPGAVYIAPGDFHMTVSEREGKTILDLNKDPAENSCRPAVDPLFRSVAAAYGDRALAVVLTGMGRDGAAGCENLRAAGARILAQDEASSVVWGMPGLVVRNGLADGVLPLGEMGPEIRRRVMDGRRHAEHGGGGRGSARGGLG